MSPRNPLFGGELSRVAINSYWGCRDSGVWAYFVVTGEMDVEGGGEC